LVNRRKAPLTALEKEEVFSFLKNKDDEIHSSVIPNEFCIPITFDRLAKDMTPAAGISCYSLDFYFALLQKRDHIICTREDRPGSLYFDSSFLLNLWSTTAHPYSKRSYDNMEYPFDMDKLIIPVYTVKHWSLLVVFMKKKEIRYFCSGGVSGSFFMKVIADWLTKQAKVHQFLLNIEEWDFLDSVDDPFIPLQKCTSLLCGLFTMAAADFLSADLPLRYGQSDMEEYRLKTGLAILRGSVSE
jgi:Ulp1 family protease